MATKFKDSGEFHKVIGLPNASKNMKRMCSNCSLPFGEHYVHDCPTKEEQKQLKVLYGTN